MTAKKDQMKKIAAEKAVSYLKSNSIIGLGTGSTVYFALELISKLIADNKLVNIKGIPSSKATEELAVKFNIPLTSLDENPFIDINIDGADEVDSDLYLIKGGGGALLKEKIIGIIFKFHKNLEEIILEFPLDILQNKKLFELAKSFIKDIIKNKEKFNENEWIKGISKEMADYFNILIFVIEKDFLDFDFSIEDEIQKNIFILKKNILNQELKIIEEKFAKAEEEKDYHQINFLEKKFREIIKKLNAIN